MARLKTHDEALRLRLINRAAATVFDRGTAALSLRQLAADVKTSTTAVYSLFGNKAGLLASLYEQAARLFVVRLAAVRPTDDPANDVIRLGLAYREYALANPHLYAILFSESPARFEPAPEGQRQMLEMYQPLVDAVRRGQQAGQFTTQLEAEVVAFACWATAHGLVSLELSGNGPPSLSIADSYERMLCAAVAGWRAAEEAEEAEEAGDGSRS
ncbi:TetR/AcrR family transcriptional regulator [Streptomyces sp. NPDC007264]|uniref:TetR/AcrR family transcriptional regulator n=1 Tax=Streptomyces sp. NPDC007264 TaxID=3364777 RepID=UPI0036D8CD97